MRLFVALRVSAEAEQALADAVEAIRDELPAARWVPRRNYHLTLSFLGEVDSGRLRGLRPALGSVFRAHLPFTASIGRSGCFPLGRPARVAWVGFHGGEALGRLQSDVAAVVDGRRASSRAGVPFRAHLTLARAKRPWPRPAVERWCERVRPAAPPFGVECGWLLCSDLGPDGARYSEVERLSLAGVAA